MRTAPVLREVVLVGGGHAHALLIRSWGMRPVPGVRLILVSENALTPYSGMLPGYVAGHYGFDEVHVDLRRLCTWAGVRFVEARMTGLDLDARTLGFEGERPPLGFDLLSLDTGSTPDLSVPGAREHSVPVKPVHDFAERWHALAARLRTDDVPEAPLDVAVVGSGAGGFEICMAMRHALPDAGCTMHWVLRGELPLGGRPERVGRAAVEAAVAAGVVVHARFDVDRVEAGPVLVAVDGRRVPLDELVWCTGAAGPDWPAAAGFATDDRGFIETDAFLRSTSHPFVFAVGDIGTQRDTPAPKAGVYAVRQAPVVLENLRRSLLHGPLVEFRPQRGFLSLMATGPKRAIASRGPLLVEGDWVWRWKDHVDGKFMHRLAELPAMPVVGPPALVSDALLDAVREDEDAEAAGALSGPRCRGCGAKVGSDLLGEALAAMGDGRFDGTGRDPADGGADADASHATGGDRDDGVLVGLADARDASVVDPGGALLVQSVDQLSAIVDDPWLFGRIAAVHALGDVIVLDARAHSALLTLVLPPAAARVQRRELAQVLAGVADALREHGVRLVGGHTAEGPELSVGLSINAFAARGVALGVDARPGDRLVLTAPVGTGALFAGAMRGAAHGPDVSGALRLMSRGQASAATLLREHGARTMTDVTGFGLAGHVERLLAPVVGVRASLDAAAVPLLPGALALARAGVRSSAWTSNRRSLERFDGADALEPALATLLADPQTAGGLLAVVPPGRAEQVVRALRAGGREAAAIVGTLVEASAHRVVVGDADALLPDFTRHGRAA